MLTPTRTLAVLACSLFEMLGSRRHLFCLWAAYLYCRTRQVDVGIAEELRPSETEGAQFRARAGSEPTPEKKNDASLSPEVLETRLQEPVRHSFRSYLHHRRTARLA